MVPFVEANAFGVILKILAAAALLVAGMRLLWLAHVDRTPKLAAKRAAKVKAYVSPHSKPLPLQPVAARLAPGRELQRLTSVLDSAQTRVKSINTTQVAAARQIDSAEMALNRLLAEIAHVMPAAIAPTIVPRRSLMADVEQRQALAA